MPLRQISIKHIPALSAFMAEPGNQLEGILRRRSSEKTSANDKKFRLWRKVIKHYARVNRDEATVEERNQAFKDFVECVQVESSPEGIVKLFLPWFLLKNKAAGLITTFVVDFKSPACYFLFGDWDWTLGEISDDLEIESRQVGFVFSDSRKDLEVVISITSRYVTMINTFSQFSQPYPSMPRKSSFIFNTCLLRETELLRSCLL